MKKAVEAIKQQLALETAATVARFTKVEQMISDGLQELRQAINDQSLVQLAALDQLLDLVAEDREAESQKTQKALKALELRVARLEKKQPPAA